MATVVAMCDLLAYSMPWAALISLKNWGPCAATGDNEGGRVTNRGAGWHPHGG